MRLTLTEAQARYGSIQNGVWSDETKWCVLYPLPDVIKLTNSQGGTQKHIYCNRDMLPALDRALKNAVARGVSSELKVFGGCFMVRDVRGEPGKPSCHSVACAVDFNPEENPLGAEPKMSPELVQCFKDEGFAWGGDFARKDGMHFSYAWE